MLIQGDNTMSRRVRVLLCAVVVAFLGLAGLAYAFSTTICQVETGEWWINIYDNATGRLTGTFHGIGGPVCPVPAPARG
jgi:hypothetical protein